LIGRQLLRSGTGVASNYRAACRATSRAEFIAKLGIVVGEADESAFWLEFLVDTGILRKERVQSLLQEAEELLRTFSSSRRTAKTKHGENKAQPKERAPIVMNKSPNHQITKSPLMLKSRST
jgi:four helix bundle protein